MIHPNLVSHVSKFMKLKDAPFLVKHEPLEDELLSSWLARIARDHKTLTTSFTNMHFPEYRKNIIWQRDLDIWASDALLQRLCDKSHVSVDRLKDTTLRSYEGKLVTKIDGKTRTPFIGCLGNYCHIKRNGGLRFCPHCLKEDSIPYFRKYWRLSFYTACLKHHTFMLDRCPQCESALTLSKTFDGKDFTHCYKCGYDLKTAPTENVPSEPYGVKSIEKLMDILNGDEEALSETPFTNSVDFFKEAQKINRKVYRKWRLQGVFDYEIPQGMSFQTKVNAANYGDYLSVRETYIIYSIRNILSRQPFIIF